MLITYGVKGKSLNSKLRNFNPSTYLLNNTTLCLFSLLDLYTEQPLRYYGVIKSQIWRALRLVIDTGLHYKNMSRNEALTIFRQYMWDNSDIV